MGTDNQKEESSGIEKLRQEIGIAKRKKIFYDKVRKTVPVTGIVVFIILTSIYFILDHKYPLALIIGIFYLVIAIVYPLTDFGKSIALEIEALESEISLKFTGSDAIEERAERLFKSHEIDLRKYYNQSLKQSNLIFLVGIFCIIVGFAFIAIIIYIVYYSTNSKPFEEKLLIGILGALSGVLTNFIGIIYLKMFSETLTSFTIFHNKLVSTNHLHFANFLISKIHEQTIRDETIKSICEKISENIK